MSAGFASASTRGVGCCSQTAFRNAYEGGSPRAGALKASRDANLRMLEEDMDHARQGIRSMERAFRNALNLRNDPEFYRSNYGVLVNNILWTKIIDKRYHSRCRNDQTCRRRPEKHESDACCAL